MALETNKRLVPNQRLRDSFVDLFWPRAPGKSPTSPLEPAWPESITLKVETLESTHESLKEEQKTETERIRTVETKLLGISGLAPVAMAVIASGLADVVVILEKELDLIKRK